MTHFLRPLYVRGLGVISLLPCVRRLPDLRVHRTTGTPSWSDKSVWFPCVFTACVMVRSKKVQIFVRLCVSVRRHVVVCVQEIKRSSITRAETQMFEVLRGGLFVRLLSLLDPLVHLFGPSGFKSGSERSRFPLVLASSLRFFRRIWDVCCLLDVPGAHCWS